ncbi:MAG: alpha/beta hydrolase [Ponticaulis sp.]|nr:alpha/beta hydrolase [Ponticaulis sp.]
MTARILGDFVIEKGDKRIHLPTSRKTRALIGVLLLTPGSQRRDHLIDVFWDMPDDPKGALRWSLTKIRQVFNDDESERLITDRERVELDHSTIAIDLHVKMDIVRDPSSEIDEVKAALDYLNAQLLLEGLELPENMTYMLWLRSEREKVRKFIDNHSMKVIEHPNISPDMALGFARNWFEQSPYSVTAANAILLCLKRLGRERDFVSEKNRFSARFREANMDYHPLSALPPVSNADMNDSAETAGEVAKEVPKQTVRFCKTNDGVSIAYASVGSGPPLVKAANWLTHLELDWDAPIWSPLFRALATENTFIRYDERGNGLSDWDVPEISQEAFVADLEAVVDAIGLKKFPLLGISQGAAVSIEYACRHPERVTKLILFGGYPAGWRKHSTPEQIAEREAVMTLVRTGWGGENPAYRRIFSTTFMPAASPAQRHWFDDFQRQTTSASNAARFLSAFGDIDVEHLLPQISVPTLILHSREDQRIPWTTARELASVIPNARLVTLESANHLLLEGEPAACEFVSAIREFLAE